MHLYRKSRVARGKIGTKESQNWVSCKLWKLMKCRISTKLLRKSHSSKFETNKKEGFCFMDLKMSIWSLMCHIKVRPKKNTPGPFWKNRLDEWQESEKVANKPYTSFIKWGLECRMRGQFVGESIICSWPFLLLELKKQSWRKDLVKFLAYKAWSWIMIPESESITWLPEAEPLRAA